MAGPEQKGQRQRLQNITELGYYQNFPPAVPVDDQPGADGKRKLGVNWAALTSPRRTAESVIS